VLIPGISDQSKRKDPAEFRQSKDPMTPRTFPGQKQMPQSAGGSTSRGNRPFTSTIPKTAPKDKWNNHQPSDENERVKAAANHPYFSMNQNILEKMFMVNHLGKKRSSPWWKEAYAVSSRDISQFLKPRREHSHLGGAPPPTAEDFEPQPDLWGEVPDGTAPEFEPSIEYIPNIASKKNIYTWADILSATTATSS